MKLQLLSRFKIRSTTNITSFIGLQLFQQGTCVHMFAKDKILKLAEVFEVKCPTAPVDLPMQATITLTNSTSEVFTLFDFISR